MSEALLLPFNGVMPRIASGVYLAPGSVVIGDVDIGAGFERLVQRRHPR